MKIILFVYAFVLVDILLVMPLSRVGRKKEEEKERPPTRSGRLCAALYCMSPPPLVSNVRLYKTEGNTEIGEGMCGGGGQISVLFVLHAPFMRVLLLPSLEPRTR